MAELADALDSKSSEFYSCRFESGHRHSPQGYRLAAFFCTFLKGREYMSKKNIKCPVCGKYTFDRENDFDICDTCGWENDGVQYSDHNYAGGANDLSVNEARIEYFLLNNAHTRTRAAVLREEYGEKREDGRDADDIKKIRRSYVNKLNKLLNG